jgi:hypothetical protein
MKTTSKKKEKKTTSMQPYFDPTKKDFKENGRWPPKKMKRT